LNYLKNTEFKILKIIPGVVAAVHIAGVRGDPCGAVRWTAGSYSKVWKDPTPVTAWNEKGLLIL